MKRVLAIQHEPGEGPGTFGDVARARGIEVRVVRVDLGEAVPRALEEDALLLLGGGWSVTEAHRIPALQEEIALAKRAVERGAPLLGICLGSQIVALALGARVMRGASKEIGWFDVDLHDEACQASIFAEAPRRFRALHWHGDVFDLPPGASSLARSAKTQHQAFSLGSSIHGVLFHLEAREAELRAMIQNDAGELAEEAIDPERLIEEASANAPPLAAVAHEVFSRFLAG